MTDHERKLLDYVKKVSAPQLLADMSGEKLVGNDLRGMRKLQLYGLPTEVANVLLYYAKLKMGKTFDYKDIYRIAARWRRLRVKTAEEAFELAKEEYSSYQQK